MSVKINLATVSADRVSEMRSELMIRVEPKAGYGGTVSYITPYTIYKTEQYSVDQESGKDITHIRDEMIVPFAYAVDKKMSIPAREMYRQLGKRAVFTGELRDAQKTVSASAKKILSATKSVLLSMPCGFGKTVTSIYLASKARLPCLVIVHTVVLLNQWKTEITRFCPNAKVAVVTGKSKILEPDCDFYIMNAINGRNKESGFFDNVGLVIIDECHRIMAEVLSTSIQHVFPRYVIGLSATPYRSDSLDKLVELYFGKRNKDISFSPSQRLIGSKESQQIEFKLNRDHTVYAVKTGFKPPVVKTAQNRVNWGAVLDAQASSVERNNLICNIVKRYKDRVFVILVKRVEQGRILQDLLVEAGERVTTLLGSQQTYDIDARVLIGTSQKIGTGFDHKGLNALILAGDVDAYFIQYLGRVFRTEDVVPIVFDLVDDNGILKKHFANRKAVYLATKGRIVPYV